MGYFSEVATLTEEAKDIMNWKIKEIELGHQWMIEKHVQTEKRQKAQLLRYEALTPSEFGFLKVPFKDIMKRMAKIHRDPVMVWSVLKEVYGLRFFEVEIQKEWDQRLAQPDEEKFLREIGTVK